MTNTHWNTPLGGFQGKQMPSNSTYFHSVRSVLIFKKASFEPKVEWRTRPPTAIWHTMKRASVTSTEAPVGTCIAAMLAATSRYRLAGGGRRKKKPDAD